MLCLACLKEKERKGFVQQLPDTRDPVIEKKIDLLANEVARMWEAKTARYFLLPLNHTAATISTTAISMTITAIA